MSNVTLTPEDRNEILKMVREDVPVAQAAKEFNVSLSTVYQLLAAEGVVPARQVVHQKVVGEDLQQMLAKYEAGIPVKVLCATYGLDGYNDFYAILRHYDIEPRTKRNSTREVREMRLNHAIQLYRDGILISEIEAETGINQPTLHKELHRRKVPMRRGSTNGD